MSWRAPMKIRTNDDFALLAISPQWRKSDSTVYRNNYLTALKALSQSVQPTPIIRTLDFARKWVAAVPWADLETARRALESCYAFVDPAEADDRGIWLRMPGLV